MLCQSADISRAATAKILYFLCVLINSAQTFQDACGVAVPLQAEQSSADHKMAGQPLTSRYQGVIEQKTGPQIAPKGITVCKCVCVNNKM